MPTLQAQNCWGVCVEEDVLQQGEGGEDSEMRGWLVRKVSESVAEMEQMLRARPRTGNLVLQNDEGVFAKALGRGPPGAMCAKDAQVAAPPGGRILRIVRSTARPQFSDHTR